MSNKTNRLVAICALYAALSGCVTEKKAHKFLDKNTSFAAKECSERFPIKETVDTVTIIDTSLSLARKMEFNYLYYIVDSLLGVKVSDTTKKEIVTIFQEKKVPVVKYKYITRVQENTAKYKALQDSCNDLSSKLYKKLDTMYVDLSRVSSNSDKYRGQRNDLIWLVIALLLALFRKPIALLLRKLIIKA